MGGQRGQACAGDLVASASELQERARVGEIGAVGVGNRQRISREIASRGGNPAISRLCEALSDAGTALRGAEQRRPGASDVSERSAALCRFGSAVAAVRSIGTTRHVDYEGALAAGSRAAEVSDQRGLVDRIGADGTRRGQYSAGQSAVVESETNDAVQWTDLVGNHRHDPEDPASFVHFDRLEGVGGRCVCVLSGWQALLEFASRVEGACVAATRAGEERGHRRFLGVAVHIRVAEWNRRAAE